MDPDNRHFYLDMDQSLPTLAPHKWKVGCAEVNAVHRFKKNGTVTFRKKKKHPKKSKLKSQLSEREDRTPTPNTLDESTNENQVSALAREVSLLSSLKSFKSGGGRLKQRTLDGYYIEEIQPESPTSRFESEGQVRDLTALDLIS